KLPDLTTLLPDRRCRALVLQCERASICGRPDAVVCCVTKKKGGVKASIVGSPAACRKGHACGASLGLFGRADACAADGTCAGATASTGTTTTTVIASSSTTSSMVPATGPTKPTSTTIESATVATSTTTPTTLLPSVALTGCAQSGYVAPVHIGSQTFGLIVDSGSTTLGVAATGCTGCVGAGVSPLYTAGAGATD